jgi:hypothetical protein
MDGDATKTNEDGRCVIGKAWIESSMLLSVVNPSHGRR